MNSNGSHGLAKSRPARSRPPASSLARPAAQTGAGLRQRIARGLHLFELVGQLDHCTDLLGFGAEGNGKRLGSAGRIADRRTDPERVCLAVHAGRDLRHEFEAVGETA